MATRFCIGLACLVGATDPSAAEMLWGANGHPFTAYPGISIRQQLDFIEDLGMKSYRVNVPDAGRASELAALVSEARVRGISILPVLSADDDQLDTESDQALYTRYRELARALGERFRNDIRVWELGNELENYAIIKPCETRDDGTQYPCAWGPGSGTDKSDYFGPRWAKVSAVLKGLSDGLTEVDPTIRKAIGTAGWGHLGAFERMKEDGIGWDISVWHTYGQDPKWAFDTLKRYGHPIWVTEFNAPGGSESGTSIQSDGLSRMMGRLEELAGSYDVEAAFIYELLDEPYWAPSFEASMGLVQLHANGEGGWRLGSPKGAYGMVREIIRGKQDDSIPARECAVDEPGAPDTAAKVAYAHCLVVGVKPTAADISATVASLDALGDDPAEIVMSVVRSEAFMRRYRTFGLTDGAFVRLLYRVLLDREADPAGLSSYALQLSTGATTRMRVAYSIISSEEFRDGHPVLYSPGKAAAADTGSPG